MTSKLALSALALFFAAPAFAGATQLERSAGVEPGVYTVAQTGGQCRHGGRDRCSR
ncbi:MAG: hypothetical protein H5U18_14275 [Rhodobacteraceae bacterium]|nr:hypothetical protein [Paracoccaceae bacterium]